MRKGITSPRVKRTQGRPTRGKPTGKGKNRPRNRYRQGLPATSSNYDHRQARCEDGRGRVRARKVRPCRPRAFPRGEGASLSTHGPQREARIRRKEDSLGTGTGNDARADWQLPTTAQVPLSVSAHTAYSRRAPQGNRARDIRRHRGTNR